MHSLVLLDINVEDGRYMGANEAIKIFKWVENEKKGGIFLDDSFIVVCARLGSLEPEVVYGKIEDLIKRNFGERPHCLVIPGKLHFMEEEVLDIYRKV